MKTILTLTLAMFLGAFLWIQNDRIDRDRRQFVQMMNVEDDQPAYYHTRGSILVMLPVEDLNPQATAILADSIVRDEKITAALKHHHIDQIEIVGMDEVVETRNLR